MDRRIRVKCLECAASIELKVDQQDLLDVTCPRCHHLFTAKVPPLVLEIVPMEIIEPIDETPPVRMTRVVQPTSPQRPNRERPKRVRHIPQQTPSPLGNSTWQAPLPQYHSAQRVSGATHLKAFLIAGGSILCLGVLVMVGMMIKSAVSSIDWSISTEEPTANAAPAVDTTVDPVASTVSSVVASTDTPAIQPSATEVDDGSSAPQTVPAAAAKKSDVGDIAEKVITLAKQLAQATKEADNEFVLDRTYPKLIQLAGGRDKMHDMLNKALEPMKTQGITIADYTISNSVVVRQVGQKIFAVLPTTMDLDYQSRVMRTDSFLLAISEDAGRTFTFLDGSGAAKNRRVLKQLLPDLPDDMVLPTPTTPREVSR